ncbi:T9SS type A sorting domain-containing protein [bacterium]|nr:T9SS type A sorting domain-containing protein [bacterium]
MKIKTNILFILALFAVLCSAPITEARIAKDRTPGELYIVGPDTSVDSLSGCYLYFSPDAGTTLVVKDSFPGHDTYYCSEFAADYTTGILYKISTESLYYSDDFGSSWVFRMSGLADYYSDLSSSRISGELFTTVIPRLVKSLDYGVTLDSLTDSFIYHYPCAGVRENELYGFRIDTGELYYSFNGGDSNLVVSSLPPGIVQPMRRGHRPGEIYILSGDSIIHSCDHCSIFTRMNSFSADFRDITPGLEAGELYAIEDFSYWDYMTGYTGGWIQICFSEDYGESFTCLKHSADGIAYDTLTGIEEISRPEYRELEIYPNPFNSYCRILSIPNVNLEIFNLRGQLIKSGETNNWGIYNWCPKDVPAGVYLAKICDGFVKLTYLK